MGMFLSKDTGLVTIISLHNEADFELDCDFERDKKGSRVDYLHQLGDFRKPVRASLRPENLSRR